MKFLKSNMKISIFHIKKQMSYEKHMQQNGGKILFQTQKQITHQIIFSHEKILQKIEFHVKKEFEMNIKILKHL